MPGGRGACVRRYGSRIGLTPIPHARAGPTAPCRQRGADMPTQPNRFRYAGSVTRTLCVALAAASTFLATLAHAASPEPWSDPDPAAPPVRTRVGDYGFRGAAEYRAQGVYVSPIDLTSETDRRASWLEHRLRLDGTLDYLDKIRVTTSIDALDGVLWGDNGNLGTEPEPTSGAHVNTNNPNDARVCVALRPGESAVSASSYHYGICPAESVFVRRLFGDVMTPVGLLRIGRQPFTEGAGVAVNDGDGRRNRFGISGRGNTADRILFATKPLEAFKAKGDRDASAARGLFLILAYDHLVTDRPQSLRYGLHEWITAVRFLEPRL